MHRHRVPLPIKKVLRDTSPDDLALQRMWASVRRRSGGEQRPRRLVLVTAMAAAAAVLIGFGLGRWSGRDPNPPGPLYLADRTAIPVLEQPAQAGAPLVIQTTDGSRISLDPGTRLEPIDNDGRFFRAQLHRGRAHLDVRAGDPRRWVIEAGRVSVEIIGSKVAIYRAERRYEVEVYEGAVMVWGPAVTGGARRLGAGQSLKVEESPASPQAVAAPPVSLGLAPRAPLVPQVPQVPQASPPASVSPQVPKASRLPTLKVPQPPQEGLGAAEAQRPPEEPRPLPSPAPAAPEPAVGQTTPVSPPSPSTSSPAPSSPPALAPLSAEDLIALADMARQSGHPRDALPLLDRVVSEHPHDPRAALAAFTRGRIESDDLSEPARAAASFRQALTLAPPQALAEDAYARLVEALLQAGQRSAAEAAATEYHTRFPAGRYRERMRQWLDAR